MTDHARLRALAEAARECGGFMGDPVNARFYAACGPTTVLSLLDEITRLQERVDAGERHCQSTALAAERDEVVAMLREVVGHGGQRASIGSIDSHRELQVRAATIDAALALLAHLDAQPAPVKEKT